MPNGYGYILVLNRSHCVDIDKIIYTYAILNNLVVVSSVDTCTTSVVYVLFVPNIHELLITLRDTTLVCQITPVCRRLKKRSEASYTEYKVNIDAGSRVRCM